MIDFEHVHFRRGASEVLRDVTFTVNPGETVALVGRSGAGKSTVLKLINRMLVPCDGAVRVDGRDTRVWDSTSLRRRTGYVLQEVGLSYLRLGQPATELSGGEAQRIKLATELQRVQTGNTLYVLDEPTTGLHPSDVQRLIKQLTRLVDAGNTVVVVEHDLDVISIGDHIIDVGPGAGEDGGRIVAVGTPQEIATSTGSRTAPRAPPRWASRAPCAGLTHRRQTTVPKVLLPSSS